MEPLYQQIIPLLIDKNLIPVSNDKKWYDVGILGKVTGFIYKKFVP